jgi:hypothetical protein
MRKMIINIVPVPWDEAPNTHQQHNMNNTSRMKQ